MSLAKNMEDINIQVLGFLIYIIFNSGNFLINIKIKIIDVGLR